MFLADEASKPEHENTSRRSRQPRSGHGSVHMSDLELYTKACNEQLVKALKS